MPETLTSRITNPNGLVMAVLVAYVLGFAMFPPRVLLIGDEGRYVSQAVAFARVSATLPDSRIVVPAESAVPSDYPPGTSLLQTPFVFLGGWPSAAWASVLCLIVTTLVVKRWLRETGRREEFALLVPSYFGSIFFGRIAMSDLPGAALTALTLWLLWKPDSSRRLFLGGLVAGSTVLFREPIAVLLAPFVIGVLWQQRLRAWPLLVGGLIGPVLRLGGSAWLFGDPLFVRDPEYGFSLGSVAHNAFPYAVILGVLFPGAILLPFLYRGERRLESRAAAIAFIALFLLYDWDSVRQNGLVRALILDTRFMLPLVPLLVMMASETWPRLARGRWAPGPKVLAFATLVLTLAAFGIHPAVRRMEGESVGLARAVQAHTTSAAPVITNHDATLKYLAPAYGDRRLILRSAAAPTDVPALLRRFGELDVLLLDRTDSELFANDAVENATWLKALRSRCRLHERLDTVPGNSLRLRVFDVLACE